MQNFHFDITSCYLTARFRVNMDHFARSMNYFARPSITRDTLSVLLIHDSQWMRGRRSEPLIFLDYFIHQLRRATNFRTIQVHIS